MCGTATADVQSANVVGYKTVQCTGNKWYMIAADFQTVGNSTAQKTIKINEFIKGDFYGDPDSIDANCPIMQIWDASGSVYATWHFYANSSGKTSQQKHDFWGIGNDKDKYEEFMAATINLGQAVWFKFKEDCTITVAGQVVEVSTSTVDVKPGEWNMIANPWPIALKINTGIDWAAQVEAGNMTGDADSIDAKCPIIQVWDPVNDVYATYHFYANSSGKTSQQKHNFWGIGNDKDKYEEFMAATVPVGYGFWFKYGQQPTDKPMTLTFTK